MTPLLLSVHNVRQRDRGECLAACVKMALDYMRFPVSYSRLLDLLRIQWFGAPSSNVRELERLGFAVVYKRGTLAELHAHLSQDRPCIAFVSTGGLPYWEEATDHAVVIVGLDERHVYLNDPEFEIAPLRVSRGDFQLAWLEQDERYAVLVRRG